MKPHIKRSPQIPRYRKSSRITTRHRVIFSDSRDLGMLSDESVDLVVTSPPYPMIEMWDAAFCEMNPSIATVLAAADGPSAFELMHRELDKVWRNCLRVLRPGGIACINVGDAVRTLGKDFRIYSNHARILTSMTALGFSALPDILWRKQTNAPTKFMGSGMLPGVAYVTYEHEYVLIFRKGGRRRFGTEAEKGNRAASAFFWEERNLWFSDVWADLKGASQDLCGSRARVRSAAFPLELAFRLIAMHSVYGDTVLDPFLWTGTTTAAAIAACRNSIGVESRSDLGTAISEAVSNAVHQGASRALARLQGHYAFVEGRLTAGHRFKHRSLVHGFPVVTSQERGLTIYLPRCQRRLTDGCLQAAYQRATRRDLGRALESRTLRGRGPSARPQSR